MKRILSLSVIALIILVGCGSQPEATTEPTEFDYFYFDTSMNIKIYNDPSTFKADKVDKQIDELLSRMENEYSPSLEDSTISQLNDGKIDTVDDEFITLLEKSNKACDITDGKYDPSAGTLIDLWSINNKNYLPTNKEIKEAQKHVGCDDVKIDGNKVILPEGYRLDFGSSVKGYAADKIEEILVDNGITNALINLGGNIQALGDKVGKPFNIGIMAPEVDNTDNANMATMEVADEAVVTSGINQRFFEQDGKVYHHIIDAVEGAPADNGLASVTIVTDKGGNADILSTSVFLMGLEDGFKFVQQTDGVDAIFITRDKKVYETKDFGLDIIDDTYSIEEMK